MSLRGSRRIVEKRNDSLLHQGGATRESIQESVNMVLRLFSVIGWLHVNHRLLSGGNTTPFSFKGSYHLSNRCGWPSRLVASTLLANLLCLSSTNHLSAFARSFPEDKTSTHLSFTPSRAVERLDSSVVNTLKILGEVHPTCWIENIFSSLTKEDLPAVNFKRDSQTVVMTEDSR
jgi:hypothetical protein